jgi:hypothetical protein
MAAGGFKEFVAGEVLDEDEINDFLMQGVLVFAGTAARGSAITSPVEGQFAFLKDSDQLTYHDGSQWVALETEPAAANISGGNGTVTSGGFKYHTFTGNGSLVVSDPGFIEVLLVAGGGAGGDNNGADQNAGGGGGAGGVRYDPSLYVAAGTCTVVVGAGGADVPSGNGSNGNDSSIEFSANGQTVKMSAYGGGGGGSEGNRGLSGGCSGGNGDNVTNAVRPIPQLDSPFILGFAGGAAISGSGGGGGGAGAVGGTGGSTGNGGIGTSLFSAWGLATTTGQNSGGTAYYSGGGGGGGFPTSGGLGGGGGGQRDGANAGNATANTGGGGGGTEEGGVSGDGGSGIVIVRVAV